MTGLEADSLELHRMDTTAAIDRGSLRLAEHMLADYPDQVLRTLRSAA